MPADINTEVKAIRSVPNAEECLRPRDRVLAAMKTGDYDYKTFPELSLRAWTVFEEVNQQNKEKTAQENTLGDADMETVHYWLYVPGEGAGMWDEFFERGIMGLGWYELGDLTAYAAKEKMRPKLQEVRGDETSQKNSAHVVWQFVHDIKPGDVIFVKRGRTEILGCGVVTGNYEYDKAGGSYPHTQGCVES